MRLPKEPYEDWAARARFNRRKVEEEDNRRRRISLRHGEVIRYLPQGEGVYLVVDQRGDYHGYCRRDNGFWVAAKPPPLLTAISALSHT